MICCTSAGMAARAAVAKVTENAGSASAASSTNATTIRFLGPRSCCSNQRQRQETEQRQVPEKRGAASQGIVTRGKKCSCAEREPVLNINILEHHYVRDVTLFLTSATKAASSILSRLMATLAKAPSLAARASDFETPRSEAILGFVM